MTAAGSPAVVRAAGGVVLRTAADGSLETLLVHRPAYDDWSVPKGKADGDERDEDCALREVEEETGLRCVLGRELTPAAYTDRRGRPKRVRYWTVAPRPGQDDAAFVPNDEIDELRWLPLDEAAALVTYEHDRLLLREAAR